MPRSSRRRALMTKQLIQFSLGMRREEHCGREPGTLRRLRAKYSGKEHKQSLSVKEERVTRQGNKKIRKKRKIPLRCQLAIRNVLAKRSLACLGEVREVRANY
ncbi:hypothetical protein E2C01_101410 [Portunus trituberculatus]|uniref:Uncharacterized protein n=1 Tax=Portunus trituberculatus TaxID=210409 RepID=A0A5B7KFP9_PORTR|nr:hypothetical protein [Portunus trituberculatus]